MPFWHVTYYIFWTIRSSVPSGFPRPSSTRCKAYKRIPSLVLRGHCLPRIADRPYTAAAPTSLCPVHPSAYRPVLLLHHQSRHPDLHFRCVCSYCLRSILPLSASNIKAPGDSVFPSSRRSSSSQYCRIFNELRTRNHQAAVDNICLY